MGCAAAREKAGLLGDGTDEQGDDSEMQSKKRERHLMEEDDAEAAAAAAALDDDNDSLEGDTPGGGRELDEYKSRSTLSILRGQATIDNPHSEGNRFISSKML